MEHYWIWRLRKNTVRSYDWAEDADEVSAHLLRRWQLVRCRLRWLLLQTSATESFSQSSTARAMAGGGETWPLGRSSAKSSALPALSERSRTMSSVTRAMFSDSEPRMEDWSDRVYSCRQERALAIGIGDDHHETCARVKPTMCGILHHVLTLRHHSTWWRPFGHAWSSALTV